MKEKRQPLYPIPQVSPGKMAKALQLMGASEHAEGSGMLVCLHVSWLSETCPRMGRTEDSDEIPEPSTAPQKPH